MRPRKPETVALVALTASVLVMLGALWFDILSSRKEALQTGEQRLQHFGVMMSEHTARAFEAVDVLLREMASDLSQPEMQWEKWEAAKGWEYLARRHSRSLPQLRDLIVFDRQGHQRFISTYFPPPSINVRDRPYFAALERGVEAVGFGPFVGRNSGRFTYALARRIGQGGDFQGAVFGALEPAYMQDFCWPGRMSDDFESVLVNAQGRIVATCRPVDTSHYSAILGGAVEEVLFDQRLKGGIPTSGVKHHAGLIVAVSPVLGFKDLRIISVIPEATVLASWRNRLYEVGSLGVLVIVIVLLGGLHIRRQMRQMTAMTDALARSHETLEQRVCAATQQIEAGKVAAERANVAKSRFLAAASHDLRQPMHALSLFAADLQHQIGPEASPDLARVARQIGASASALGEMLDAMLDISRLDVGGIQPAPRPFALGPLLERVGAAFRRNATDRQIVLRIRRSARWVHSDPAMIERIVGNLVSNAIRYTPAGGRILVAARRHGENLLRIEVRDNGPGIPPEHQEAIFAEFYQVGNAAREQNKGLGLGLSIVDRLARALQAPVGLRSRVGEGTVFSLVLPAISPDEDLVAPPPVMGRVHFVGDPGKLATAKNLAESWGFVTTQEVIPVGCRPALAAVVVALGRDAATVRESLPPGWPLIALVETPGQALPEGVQGLPLPVRPARLRALLGQLQKVLPKSMP